MATGETFFESDGKSVEVTLSYEVTKNQIAVVEGWLGMMARDGESGDTRAMSVDQREYQVVVPSGLSASKGETIFIEIADVTGHTPDDTAYSTSAGAGKIAAFKLTSDKDGNNVVTGIFLGQLAS